MKQRNCYLLSVHPFYFFGSLKTSFMPGRDPLLCYYVYNHSTQALGTFLMTSFCGIQILLFICSPPLITEANAVLVVFMLGIKPKASHIQGNCSAQAHSKLHTWLFSLFEIHINGGLDKVKQTWEELYQMLCKCSYCLLKTVTFAWPPLAMPDLGGGVETEVDCPQRAPVVALTMDKSLAAWVDSSLWPQNRSSPEHRTTFFQSMLSANVASLSHLLFSSYLYSAASTVGLCLSLGRTIADRINSGLLSVTLTSPPPTGSASPCWEMRTSLPPS